MSDLEPFPDLIEGRRLNAERINGVDPVRLTIGAERDAVVTFRDEVAAFGNVLGVYLIDPDGTVRDPEIVFARIEHADPLPGLPLVRPGGGPLEPGAAVHLNTLYRAADLEPGQRSACSSSPTAPTSTRPSYPTAAAGSSSSTPQLAARRTLPTTTTRSRCATSRAPDRPLNSPRICRRVIARSGVLSVSSRSMYGSRRSTISNRLGAGVALPSSARSHSASAYGFW